MRLLQLRTKWPELKEPGFNSMKKLLSLFSIIAVLVLFNQPLFYAQAAGITLDNTGGGSIGSATLTISFTTAANTLIIVGAENDNPVSGMTATWNGTSMTKDIELDAAAEGIDKALFSIYETTGGTHDIVVTGGSAYTEANIASFLGAANGHAVATDSGSTNVASPSVTSTVNTSGFNNAVHVMNSYASSQTAGTATQLLGSIVDSNRALWASNPLSVTPAGSNSIVANIGTASGYVYVGAAYAAAAATTMSHFNFWHVF